MPEGPLHRQAAVPGPARRGYLDWIRGIAVLIMIEAHVVDSWTTAPDRFTKAFDWAMVLGGFGAPLFLLLAGVSVSLSAGSKSRRTGDVTGASRAVMRRGLEIFLLAFAFRVQAWILGWSSARTLLRVDILNVMGPAIIIAALLWGMWSTSRGRALALAAAMLAFTLLTPIVRLAPWLSPLPDPIEAYIRPAGGMTSFAFFPWAAFAFAGAWLGVLIDGTSTVRTSPAALSGETRLNLAFVVCGALLAAGAYAASFLPSLYGRSDFWTTSPAFFFLRLGLLVLAIGLTHVWELRPGATGTWSLMRQLGRTSLFVYWIHVEMVYGLISLPLHHALTLPQTTAGLVLFSAFMLVCSIGKDRAVGWWRARRQQVLASSTARAS